MSKFSNPPLLTDEEWEISFREGATDEEIEVKLRDLMFWSFGHFTARSQMSAIGTKRTCQPR